ncbi:hypothetical protein AB0L70_35685 [Kribbella sp. NPDC051952]|uniref:hypothetical protein n=1 Tax=Kribbella sp. NPDC051952 TaxID=3154851 RepID=UPI00343D4F28
MSRQPLPIGNWGRISTKVIKTSTNGKPNRARTSQSAELGAMHKITHVLDLWEKRFEGLVADGKRSPTSLDTYRRVIKNHVRPALGELRISEATTPRVDAVLTKIKHTAGASTAKPPTRQTPRDSRLPPRSQPRHAHHPDRMPSPHSQARHLALAVRTSPAAPPISVVMELDIRLRSV